MGWANGRVVAVGQALLSTYESQRKETSGHPPCAGLQVVAHPLAMLDDPHALQRTNLPQCPGTQKESQPAAEPVACMKIFFVFSLRGNPQALADGPPQLAVPRTDWHRARARHVWFEPAGDVLNRGSCQRLWTGAVLASASTGEELFSSW